MLLRKRAINVNPAISGHLSLKGHYAVNGIVKPDEFLQLVHTHL